MGTFLEGIFCIRIHGHRRFRSSWHGACISLILGESGSGGWLGKQTRLGLDSFTGFFLVLQCPSNSLSAQQHFVLNPMPILDHVKLQHNWSIRTAIVKVQTYLWPCNQLTHTRHALEFWGIWVAEDTEPILGQSRLNRPILVSLRRKRTINRVRGHILQT